LQHPSTCTCPSSGGLSSGDTGPPPAEHTGRIDAHPDTLQRLLDERAIHRRLTDYCRGVDRCDAELIASVYHPDARDDHGSFVGLGVDFAAYVVERLGAGYDATLHNIGNTTIDFVDDDTAHVETYVHAVHRRQAGEGQEIVSFGGRYVDRFERRDGEWRIADRVVVHEWNRVEPTTPAYPPGYFREGERSRDDRSYRR
jgi:hypothetical protein